MEEQPSCPCNHAPVSTAGPHEGEYTELDIGSRCVHAGKVHDQYRAVVMPIYQCSTFAFDDVDQGARIFKGEEDGYKYTRLGNPTNTVLQGRLASLEGSEACLVFSSGMGAIQATLFALLSAGDHVIADECLYGCTFSLLSAHFTRFGVEVDFCDLSIPGAVRQRMKANTRVVYLETPANPTLKITDIRRVHDEMQYRPKFGKDECPRSASGLYVQQIDEMPRSHSNCFCGCVAGSTGQELPMERNCLLIVDNTFASPICTRPIALGADIVLHSATKYLSGGCDLLAGAVCASQALISRILMNGLLVCGAVLSPHDAFLVLRGLTTLKIRMKHASESAMFIARTLAAHPAVSKVYYPGLEEFPGHDIAASQMDYFGAMMSFEVRGGVESAKKLLNGCKLFTQAVSLGGCESLITNPATTTHVIVPPSERAAAGIDDGLIRASIGIEDPQDLARDLLRGLDQIKADLGL